MPILKVTNQVSPDEATMENGAQVNRIEEIQIDGISLNIDDKKINIPLATEEDIASLFEKEVET